MTITVDASVILTFRDFKVYAAVERFENSKDRTHVDSTLTRGIGS
jgi:hypothetical protein